MDLTPQPLDDAESLTSVPTAESGPATHIPSLRGQIEKRRYLAEITAPGYVPDPTAPSSEPETELDRLLHAFDAGFEAGRIAAFREIRDGRVVEDDADDIEGTTDESPGD